MTYLHRQQPQRPAVQPVIRLLQPLERFVRFPAVCRSAVVDDLPLHRPSIWVPASVTGEMKLAQESRQPWSFASINHVRPSIFVWTHVTKHIDIFLKKDFVGLPLFVIPR